MHITIDVYWFFLFLILNFTSMLCFYFQLKAAKQQFAQKIRQYEFEIETKAREVAQVIEELKGTQLKLIESGKMSAVASLSAGILHQISQPITAIRGFAKFLKKEMRSSDDFYRPICWIEEQSEYLKEMLQNLMEILSHRLIKKEPININEVVTRSVNLLKDELRIRRINWDLNLAEDPPPLHADSIHLQQVIMNIVINAMQVLAQLTKDQRRYISITTEVYLDKRQILISIKDTGPGISEENISRVFEPLFSTKSKGAGIGLALCQDIVREHAGSISVENLADAGAHFMIFLPYTAQPQAPSTQELQQVI